MYKLLIIPALLIGFGIGILTTTFTQETPLGAGEQVVTENGVEKAVVVNETKLSKEEVKSQLENYKVVKQQLDAKCDEEKAFVNSTIDKLQVLLTKFKK